MKLATEIPSSITQEKILVEASQGMAILHFAREAFINGKPAQESIEKAALEYRSPSGNRVLGIFLSLHQYAFGDIRTNVSDDDLFYAFAFVLAVRPLAEFFAIHTPNCCEAVLQASFARDKLYDSNGVFEPVVRSKENVHKYAKHLPGGDAKGLTVFELALLSRMNEQSVRNALQRNDTIKKDKGRDSRQIEISVEAARNWLETKDGFTRVQPPTSPDHISVPVARDGSVFGVKCKRRMGYSVGRKGDESNYAVFEDALAKLKSMEIPYWRRPSPTSGVPGIVRGIRWIPKTRKELGLEE